MSAGAPPRDRHSQRIQDDTIYWYQRMEELCALRRALERTEASEEDCADRSEKASTNKTPDVGPGT
jgi:hypothetical protein